MLTLSAKSDASRRHAPRKTRRKPRRRRQHRMAVIVETDLPPMAQGEGNASLPPAASGLNSAVPHRPLAQRAVNQAVGRFAAPFGFVVKYPSCLDNRAFRWPGRWCGVRKIGDVRNSRCMKMNWRRSRSVWNVAGHWARRLGCSG